MRGQCLPFAGIWELEFPICRLYAWGRNRVDGAYIYELPVMLANRAKLNCQCKKLGLTKNL